MNKSIILIVDADPKWTSLLTAGLTRRGFSVQSAGDGALALDLACRCTPAVVLVDPALPGYQGLDIVRRLRTVTPQARFIMATGRASTETMVEAIREHVFDFLCKPISLKTLEESIGRALQEARLPGAGFDCAAPVLPPPPGVPWEELARLERRPAETPPVLIGESKAMAQVRQQIAEVAPTTLTVLIRGESGTGKGIIARLIHEASPRARRGALVKINCPAIPESLLESELFGHEAGALADAKNRKPGRFELAHGGTVFLDEIGELPPFVQVKLLQVIEHKEFQRLGGGGAIRLDARILAATNAALESMLAAGAFRADLFYRLNEYAICLPPLRERLEDIPLLAAHFLNLYGQEFGRPGLTLSSRALALLMRRPWRGNVRELESVIRRYALTGREDALHTLLQQPAGQPAAAGRQETETLRQVEIQAIMSALVEARWNQRRAAVLLGLSYSALRRRIDKYGLKVSSTHRPPAVASISREIHI